MIGWRRRAKATRESTISPERLYELVNQTLMENFGPLGSFAITRRSSSDTDDIFHTALARSVAHDIVANLAEHGISVRTNLGLAAPAAAPAPVFGVRTLSTATPATQTRAAQYTPAAQFMQTAGSMAPIERVEVPRRLAGAVSAAASAAPMPVRSAPVSITGMPIMLTEPLATAPQDPDPRDDDALRSLVAHHAEVTAATEHNRTAAEQQA